MTPSVLDACALIAYLRGEVGAAIVDALLRDPKAECLIHAVNLCEVYYQLIRDSDEASARQVIVDLKAAGLIVRNDMDEHCWQSVGQLKARGGISLADCFCITLAIRVSGEVVTSDHREFDPLVPLGLCPILFIR
jgi:PIN domain nuclease of toxin-antitoxin system